MRLCETANIPFAPVAKVEDLFDDPHLLASGGLLDSVLPGDIRTKLPRLPIEIGSHRLGVRPPAPRLGGPNGGNPGGIRVREGGGAEAGRGGGATSRTE